MEAARDDLEFSEFMLEGAEDVPAQTILGELAWYITLFPVGQASFTPPWTREKIGLEMRRIVFNVMGKLDYSLDAGFAKT